MNARNYAQALYDLSQTDHKPGLAARFVSYAKARGHAHLLVRISRELERIAKSDARAKVCEIVVADQSYADAARRAAEALVKDAGEDPVHWTFAVREDASLIGGYVVRTTGREQNASYKSALQNLYERLIEA